MRRRQTIQRSRIKGKIEWTYQPTDRQRAFHSSTARFKLFGGAMGGGKSYALCAECIDLCLNYEGNRGYLCRQHLVDLRRSTLDAFFRICPRELIRRHWREDRIIEFWNGSELLYGALGAADDIDRIKSTEFGFFAIDEATETYEEYFLLLASRLRWRTHKGVFVPYHGLLATNPEPGWVKDRFIDQTLKDHAFIPALPTDNPHLPEDYVVTLEGNFSEEWIARYLKGSWDTFEGQIYTEFERDKHIYKDIGIGEYWHKVRVIDHGYVNPTCCLWAAGDFDGNLWIYDEHYEKGLTVEENAHVINQKHPNFKGVTLIDPSCFSITQVTTGMPCSIADEYNNNGIPCISPYSKDGWAQEGVGINLVKQRLKGNKLPDGTWKPSLLIHERCVNTIKEIVNLKWRTVRPSERNKGSRPEVPVDINNHACDDLRYLCVWKPHGSPPPDPVAIPGSIKWEIMKHKRQLNLPQFAGWD